MSNFFNSLKEWIVVNFRTTVTGLVAALAVFLIQYGVTLSESAQQKLTGWVVAGGLFLIGLFSKDASSGKEG